MHYLLFNRVGSSHPCGTTKRSPLSSNPAADYISELVQAGYSLAAIAKQTDIHPSTLRRTLLGQVTKSRRKTFTSLIAMYCQFIELPRHQL